MSKTHVEVFLPLIYKLSCCCHYCTGNNVLLVLVQYIFFFQKDRVKMEDLSDGNRKIPLKYFQEVKKSKQMKIKI